MSGSAPTAGTGESEQVVDLRRQPGALREEIEGAKLALTPGVLELEAGMKIDHAVIPIELAAIDQDGHDGGEESLGDRADLKDGAQQIRRRTPKPLA